jgi:hypothetical protein
MPFWWGNPKLHPCYPRQPHPGQVLLPQKNQGCGLLDSLELCSATQIHCEAPGFPRCSGFLENTENLPLVTLQKSCLYPFVPYLLLSDIPGKAFRGAVIASLSSTSEQWTQCAHGRLCRQLLTTEARSFITGLFSWRSPTLLWEAREQRRCACLRPAFI